MAIPNRRLLDFLLTRSATHAPDRLFLEDDLRRVTYAEAVEEVNRGAGSLHREGIRRGDRVAICCQNRVEVPLAALAALRADALFVIINPTTRPEKLRYLLADSGARALVVDGSTATAARQALELLEGGQAWNGPVYEVGASPTPAHLPWSATLAAAPGPPPRQAIDADLAALIYTSGSTGQPRGVMLTHANLRHTTWSISTYLENRPDDIILDALPLSFDYGLYQVLTAMRVGATVLLERGFSFPYAVFRRMAERGVTGFPGVPTMFALLLALRDLDGLPRPPLRYLTNTADVLPPDHIRRLTALFPAARLFSMYGLTECTRVSYLEPAELVRRPGSVGKAIPNTEVWLEREDGTRPAPGEPGILVVRGGHVSAGYWRQPEASARLFRTGPVPGERILWTGDWFRTDEEGFLYYLGRSDHIIKSRGEKVSPREVEVVLYTHPAVTEAAVVGEPDPILGAAIVAHVHCRPDLPVTEAELGRLCREQLEEHLLPRRIHLHAEPLPKTATGKLDRQRLLAPRPGYTPAT